MCQKTIIHEALWVLKDEQDTALAPLSNSAPRVLEKGETATGRRGWERAWWHLKWATVVMIKPQKTIDSLAEADGSHGRFGGMGINDLKCNFRVSTH